jgi:cation diffusion facilitator CzcD-associated flavoprotein CzcO
MRAPTSARQKDAVIIGAGPGGLAAAMLLAAAGAKVTLFEKDKQVGGRTKVFSEDGFRRWSDLLPVSADSRISVHAMRLAHAGLYRDEAR